MLRALNHVAIVVPDLEAAAQRWQELFGAEVSAPVDLPEHGVRTVFIELPNAKIELLGILGENSPIAGFLERNPSGGIHHVCIETSSADLACKILKERGGRITGDGTPKIGAHGLPVIFVHPKSTGGALIELEQTKP